MALHVSLIERRADWQDAGGLPEQVEQIPELDVAAMIAAMRPPTDDDVSIALDGTPLDAPAKVIAYLEVINARRDAAERRAS